MLGIRTQGRRIEGTDETTELWRPPYPFLELAPAPIWFTYRLTFQHHSIPYSGRSGPTTVFLAEDDMIHHLHLSTWLCRMWNFTSICNRVLAEANGLLTSLYGPSDWSFHPPYSASLLPIGMVPHLLLYQCSTLYGTSTW